jgi:hypothetical protein
MQLARTFVGGGQTAKGNSSEGFFEYGSMTIGGSSAELACMAGSPPNERTPL